MLMKLRHASFSCFCLAHINPKKIQTQQVDPLSCKFWPDYLQNFLWANFIYFIFFFLKTVVG